MEIKGEVLIVGSSGFQMGRTTEYIEYKHMLIRRKKWVKLHVIYGVCKQCFSAMKRMFGETLSSRKPAYVVRELLIMLSLFNIFHSL